ncbi:sortase [Christensenellaceae bacterium OttesenSCG-928-L17]|nr:sortase [Christensenellaceae bacterium OttesenSCG-928-L17]
MACVLALVGVMLAATAIVLLIGREPEQTPKDDTLSITSLPALSASPTPSEAPQSSAPEETPPPPRVRALPETLEGYPVEAKLTIETLGSELFVLGDSSDAALEVSPGLYSGPDSPEFAGNIVITGHNYKNDSHFGRLDELEDGDVVTFTDKWGGEYRYEVYDSETIAPDQIAALEEYEGERALALLTCTKNGKSRLLVRCRLLE